MAGKGRRYKAREYPWPQIVAERRSGSSFRALHKKFKVPLSTLHGELSCKLGVFPGDPVTDPLLHQAIQEDERSPARIAFDALMRGLRNVERRMKDRFKVNPRELESLLKVYAALKQMEEMKEASTEIDLRTAELKAERRQLAAALDELDARTELAAQGVSKDGGNGRQDDIGGDTE